MLLFFGFFLIAPLNLPKVHKPFRWLEAGWGKGDLTSGSRSPKGLHKIRAVFFPPPSPYVLTHAGTPARGPVQDAWPPTERVEGARLPLRSSPCAWSLLAVCRRPPLLAALPAGAWPRPWGQSRALVGRVGRGDLTDFVLKLICCCHRTRSMGFACTSLPGHSRHGTRFVLLW